MVQQAVTRVEIGKGHAHNPLEDTLFLDIDAPEGDMAQEYQHLVCESPSAVDMDVYEKAYEEEIQKIVKDRGQKRPTLYLTRRVEGKKSIRENPSLLDAFQLGQEVSKQGASALAKLVEKAKNIQVLIVVLWRIESSDPAIEAGARKLQASDRTGKCSARQVADETASWP